MARTLIPTVALVCVLLLAGAARAQPTIAVHGVRGEPANRSPQAALVASELAVHLHRVSSSCHLDATITRIEETHSARGAGVVVTIRFAVSNARGVLVSVVDGTAHAEATRKPRRAELERDALIAAVANASTRLDRSLRAESSEVAAR